MSTELHSISTVDTHYLMPRLAAAYLVQDGEEAVFIENNTNHAIPYLKKALDDQGIAPEQVKYVIVTHVHLDHAGGTGELMKLCPQAKLVVHPKGARHMIDPEALVNSSKEVYGQERFKELYGEVVPVEASRVIEAEDGKRLSLGKGELEVFHSHGHAYHHMSVVDHGGDAIFTGDSTGLCYPDLQRGGLFIYPATTPTQFDPEQSRKTMDRTVSYEKSRLFPTHFGELTQISPALEILRSDIDAMEGLVHTMANSDLSDEQITRACAKQVKEYYFERFAAVNNRQPDSHEQAYLEMDLELNAQGIAYAARKLRSRSR